MSWWVRMMLVVAVALIPGAFVLLLAYIATRTMRERWRLARVQAERNGTPVSLRDVLATVELKDLVRQARAAL
jgi:predicted CDP-diglyceride synthetase/phosphatidate cytidylyltransferase